MHAWCNHAGTTTHNVQSHATILATTSDLWLADMPMQDTCKLTWQQGLNSFQLWIQLIEQAEW